MHCPIHHPSRDKSKKRFLYIKQVHSDENKWHYCDPPAQFCEVRSEFFTSHMHTNGKPAFFIFEFRINYGRFRIFSNRCIGHISRTKRNYKKRQAFYLLVGARSTPCKKIASNCVKLSRAYHITSYRIISYHIISYHIVSYHIISYHITSYRIMSYHIIAKQRLEQHVGWPIS